MRKRHRKKWGTPYIRKFKEGDRSTSLRVAYHAAYLQMHGSCYVSLQHGSRHGLRRRFSECASTRLKLKRLPLPVARGAWTYRQWQRSVRDMCTP